MEKKNIGIFIYNIITLLTFLLLISTHDVIANHLSSPVISIIIDDLGYRNVDDINALKLPGPITFAIMPHSPNSLKVSALARQSDNNIILHLPMEAVENEKNRFLGPGALKVEMSENEFISTLSKNIHSIPNIIGVNNHMGSLLTKHTEQMEWLMDYLSLQKIFYVDSLTSSETVANYVAHKKNVPYLKRDIFLDNFRDREYINKQFKELVTIAKRKGSAIAIGHPHPETIEVLNDNLRRLDEYGVRLINLKDMIKALHNNEYNKISFLN